MLGSGAAGAVLLLRAEGAGFGGTTNRLTLISPTGEKALPLLSKDQTAHALLDEILSLRK